MLLVILVGWNNKMMTTDEETEEGIGYRTDLSFCQKIAHVNLFLKTGKTDKGASTR